MQSIDFHVNSQFLAKRAPLAKAHPLNISSFAGLTPRQKKRWPPSVSRQDKFFKDYRNILEKLQIIRKHGEIDICRYFITFTEFSGTVGIFIFIHNS
jgi:hypothetical protein